jgi:replicative DNA helicase
MTHHNGSATKSHSEILDRQPPCNPEAEAACIGAMLNLPDLIDDLSLVVRPVDFTVPGHEAAYRLLLDMHNAGKHIDIVTFMAEAKKRGVIDAIGTRFEIGLLINAAPTSFKAVRYAELVQETSIRRRAIHAATAMLRQAFDESTPTADFLLNCQAAIEGLELGADKGSVTTAGEAVDAVTELIERLTSAKVGHRVGTGFTSIDQKIGGVFPGELVVIAARPGVGKTTIGLAIAYANAARGVPSLFFSTEMSPGELLLRSVCAAAPVSSSWLRTGNLIDADRPRLEAAKEAHRQALLFVDDRPNPSVAEIRRTARREVREHGIKLVVVDYLQRLRPADDRRQRYEQVGQIVASLKTLARELNVPVIALAQLSRDADGATPTLAHLRESGSIESEADQVWLLDRPGMYRKDDADLRYLAVLNVAKNRNGETGEVRLRWDSVAAKFCDEPAAPAMDTRKLWGDG